MASYARRTSGISLALLRAVFFRLALADLKQRRLVGAAFAAGQASKLQGYPDTRT